CLHRNERTCSDLSLINRLRHCIGTGHKVCIARVDRTDRFCSWVVENLVEGRLSTAECNRAQQRRAVVELDRASWSTTVLGRYACGESYRLPCARGIRRSGQGGRRSRLIHVLTQHRRSAACKVCLT